MAKLRDVFECSACYKCGGDGRIAGFGHVLGGVCFACGGDGYKFTRRGASDYERYRSAVDAATLRPVSQVVAGDAVAVPGMMRKYYRVTHIDRVPATCWETGKPRPDAHILHFSHEFQISGPLPYKTDRLEVALDAEVHIWAGEAMPNATDFATHAVLAR